MKVSTAEPGSEAADACREGHSRLAPELTLAEVGNGRWRKVRVGSLTPAPARTALAQLQDWLEPRIPCTSFPPRPSASPSAATNPVHDCYDVALAMRRAVPLATGDRRLAARFAGDADIRPIY